MTQSEFLAQLDQILEERSILKHPFYQLWNEGGLKMPALREYAGEYFRQVQAFPTYVSAVHSASEDLELRQMLLENLIEEEQGDENHPELWLRFAEGLGAKRDEILERKTLPTTDESVSILRKLTRSEDPAIGLAALYAYESQVPEVATTKIRGLKEFYGMDDARSLQFFTVHQGADEIHSAVEREALQGLCGEDSTRQEAVLAAAGEAADALNLLLDGVYKEYC